jgi:hypothetical protein
MARYARKDVWCSKCRKSLNYAKGTAEPGLSIYECEPAGDKKWRLIGKAWAKNGKNLAKSKSPWLLVEGHAIAGRLGADGEPLLDAGFAFVSLLKVTDTESVLEEDAGNEPKLFEHPDNCTPPAPMGLYASIAEEQYGGGDDDTDGRAGEDDEQEEGGPPEPA